MKEVIIGAFRDQVEADKAIDDLGEFGYDARDISVVMQGNRERAAEEIRGETSSPGQRFASGLGVGVVEGGIIGGLAGLLAGALGIIIVGPIALLLGTSGVLGTTITGLVVGAAAGGLVGALVGLGVPRETATSYEECVRAGGVLVAVPIDSTRRERVREIYASNGAQDLAEIEVPTR